MSFSNDFLFTRNIKNTKLVDINKQRFKFGFSTVKKQYKIIIVFFKDVLNWSKVSVKSFMMLQ